MALQLIWAIGLLSATRPVACCLLPFAYCLSALAYCLLLHTLLRSISMKIDSRLIKSVCLHTYTCLYKYMSIYVYSHIGDGETSRERDPLCSVAHYFFLWQDAFPGISNRQVNYIFNLGKTRLENMLLRGNKSSLPAVVASILLGIERMHQANSVLGAPS